MGETNASVQKGVYESIRALFLDLSKHAPSSGVNVNALPRNEAALVLGGCWEPDGKSHDATSWCGREVSMVLQRPSASSNLSIKGWLPWSSLEKAGRTSPVIITVTVNDVAASRTEIAAEGPFTINIPSHDLPARKVGSDLALIRISTDASFRARQFLQAADERDLSIELASVEFSLGTSR